MARGSCRSRLTGVVGFIIFLYVCDLCRAPSAVRTSTLAAFFVFISYMTTNLSGAILKAEKYVCAVDDKMKKRKCCCFLPIRKKQAKRQRLCATRLRWDGTLIFLTGQPAVYRSAAGVTEMQDDLTGCPPILMRRKETALRSHLPPCHSPALVLPSA